MKCIGALASATAVESGKRGNGDTKYRELFHRVLLGREGRKKRVTLKKNENTGTRKLILH